MTKKKKIVFCVVIVTLLPLIFFLTLYIESQSLDGIHRSRKVEILLDDFEGYEYYQDGKFYIVNLSDRNGDEVELSGTYKKIDKYKYLIKPDWDREFEVNVDLFGLSWDQGFMNRLSLLEDHSTIVFSPFKRSRIKKLVEEYKQKK